MVTPARRPAAAPTSHARAATHAETNITFAGDEALVAGLKRGHPAARAAFFDSYHARARRILLHVLGRDSELSDVLHDVFLNAYRSIHTIRDASALSGWFTRVTVFTARKVLRSRKRRAWLRLFVNEDQEQSYERAAPGDPEAARALRAAYEALGKLSSDEQIVFALHYVQGMSLAEVATACDVSLTTAKRRAKSARSRFLAEVAGRSALVAWLKQESS